MDNPPVTVIRSSRRRRTIAGRMESGRFVVRIPDTMTAQEEREAVAELLQKMRRKTGRSRGRSDADLQRRAGELNRLYLQEKATPGAVRWVSNQKYRWGSCTVGTGDIRLSDRLKGMPGYVIDSVLVHELIHTFVPGGHGKEFQQWEKRYPHAQRARGYLEAAQRYLSAGSEGPDPSGPEPG